MMRCWCSRPTPMAIKRAQHIPVLNIQKWHCLCRRVSVSRARAGVARPLERGDYFRLQSRRPLLLALRLRCTLDTLVRMVMRMLVWLLPLLAGRPLLLRRRCAVALCNGGNWRHQGEAREKTRAKERPNHDSCRSHHASPAQQAAKRRPSVLSGKAGRHPCGIAPGIWFGSRGTCHPPSTKRAAVTEESAFSRAHVDHCHSREQLLRSNFVAPRPDECGKSRPTDREIRGCRMNGSASRWV